MPHSDFRNVSDDDRSLACLLRGGPLDGEQISVFCRREVAPFLWYFLVGNATYGYRFVDGKTLKENMGMAFYEFTGDVIPVAPDSAARQD